MYKVDVRRMISIIYKTQDHLLDIIGSDEDHPLMDFLDEISDFIEDHEENPGSVAAFLDFVDEIHNIAEKHQVIDDKENLCHN